ncbi:protein transport protein Sec16A isoform X2 [Sorex araneus]|uniref:protein transport protein Sec16A isoform X2 n=1 Tax=Sorex araneus TaxID=42254 RepID=UPI002433ACDA|nr:protein transport protein Sec16A isoform X2 [Sorex araneus]
MQPPPQAVPSGVVGPPPAGNPPSTFWSSSPYRRQVAPGGTAAPVPCPVQPVTDPFAFSRQALQSPAMGSAAHSGLQGLAPSTSLQHPGQPLRPLSATHGSHGPLEPLPRPLSQPRPEASAFSSLVAPSAPPGLGVNRGAEAASSSETQVQTPPYLPQYIPAGPDMSIGGHNSGNVPGPDRPCSGQNPHAAAAPPVAPPSFPLSAQPLPGQWGPAQGGLPPSTQHSWPCPEGPVPITVPPVSRATHFPASLHQGPGREPLNPPVSVPAPGAGLSGNPSVASLHPENAFRRDSRAGTGLASQELRPAPGMTWEQMPAPALANPAAQGNSSESHLHPLAGARPSHALPQGDSGALSMFFQGGETENEENLSYEKPGSAAPADLDGVAPNPGPGHPGPQSVLLRSPNSENMQQGGDAQAYFSQSLGVQHERQTTKSVSLDPWGDPARAGAPKAPSAQYENVENLEFVQNQEVLPSEPPGVELAPSDQPRYGLLPGPASSRLGVPDAAPHPVRPDSASSGHSSRSLRTLPGAARPQDLAGTFIQQEVGKPEGEAPGSFFKQIDSSPVGGEVDEAPGGQSYQSSLSQPPTPSPPKPTGVFQTSANSSFEPVKSHLVGVKPVEADRANVVGEVRDTHAQQTQPRAAAAPPDASPGNLEQPPDNMETLFMPRDGPLPPATAKEAGHGPSHAVGPPSDAALPTPEKRPLTRAQGAGKCESPATTLWAQNELPDFGGNVLLAPAAPVLHVPVNPRPLEVIQPPDEGVFSQQPSSRPPLPGGDTLGASENLENPPKMGEEEALPSQVARDAQEPQGPEKAQLEPAPPPLSGHRAALPEPSDVGSPLGPGQSQNSAQPPASLATTDTGQQLPPPRPPPTSSVAVAATASSQATVRPDQQWPQSPPPDYYYYRPLYDGYQPQYPSPYPPDPAAGPLYYQDVYGMYDPRYRPYDSTTSAYAESYRYPEPERPSSRASHSSDRPPARRECPEGYYSSKGWSSQSDYYANYYSGQYDYGDLGRWDRYHYGSRFRDPRAYDQRYWHDAEYDMYRKDSYAHGDRSDKYDDPWRYDPRFTGSFDDDPEPRRDPYGEEADRHSVHSEHSAQSLRSRRSSLSSHSHQSQMYRGHHVTAGSYDAPHPPGSFHGDYTYGAYGGAFPEASWSTVERAPSRPTSPEKFPVPHLCARFGPGGQLIKVMPNLPSEGQPALVEIHSMESLLQHTPEQEEMRSFPGPLGKDDTHKVDVINFAQKKATKCLQDENLLDKESASLLWNFIVLLCRQNGTVVGTDIAELLLRDHKTVWLPGKSPNEANLIDFTHEAVERVEEEESVEAQLSFLGGQPPPASTLEKEVERFRELLLYGRKKDALESAMKNALWGHALLLASKMDSRTHAKVMTRFANSLPINDPLQTVYQLMSGRMPAASTCCGDEKWGDWRPHLAMVLSNLSSNMDVESRTMVTMGDTLASKGLLDAAHFCYLMAQLGFGVYTKKSTKLVLIGSNHSLPFPKFATNEAIQRTEAYEYAQSLGAQTCALPNFQVFKFIYSCRLAEMGLATQAFHYCEVIAQSILAQPHSHSPVLISQLVQVASQLRLFDPQLKERPEEESFVEPAWLTQLQRVDEQVKEGAVVWRQDAAVPQCRPSSPSSDVGSCEGPGSALPAGPGPDNPLLAPPMPAAEPLGQSVRLLPSAPQRLPGSQPALPAGVPMFPVPAPPGPALGFPEPSVPDPTALYPGPGLPPGGPPLQEPGATLQEAPGRHLLPELREGDVGGALPDLGPPRVPQDYEPSVGWEPPPPAPSPIQDVKRAAPAKKEPKEPKKSSEPWFFSRWLYGKKRTEAYLPDDKNKSIVWDEKKNRWVDVNEPEEEKKAPPPPPTSLLKAPQAAPPGPGGAPRASVNMFSRKAAGSRARYVDVLNPGGTQRSDPALAPADFFAPLAPLPIPALVGGPQADADTLPSAEGPDADGEEPRAPGDAPAAGHPPGGAVPFYNPVQFTPVSATSGSSRAGRLGARKQAALS